MGFGGLWRWRCEVERSGEQVGVKPDRWWWFWCSSGGGMEKEGKGEAGWFCFRGVDRVDQMGVDWASFGLRKGVGWDV